MGNKSGRLSLERVLLEGIEEMVFIVKVEEAGWVYECINDAVKPILDSTTLPSVKHFLKCMTNQWRMR
ncbi:hypothetical protein [Planococcus dechangensis]|uniref:Uncharacterized protein n=1 Tax=Planococcus dechangensis TaxID=1176255 RepID=A0ABV9MBM3_9BACL